MSYFESSYDRIRLPIAADGREGLRRSQLGAIHAVASHFTLHREPAIVVMPTGSGKTAVLILSAFLLQATRVLVIAPSRLVRGQVAERFATLDVLRRIGAVDLQLAAPTTKEVDSRIGSVADWETLRSWDVVVGLPQSVSPAITGVQPPGDLFDLVLIDEAHHSPAETWNATLAAFPVARRVLLTATPFRSDALEIKGHFVYSYPVAEAFKDGIFGAIDYRPVNDIGAEDSDVAVARAAEYILKEDRAGGLAHCLMVRTDRISRAQTLAEVYQKQTSLSLQIITGNHSNKHVKSVLKKMEQGELDGIICVAMLGEGFDFPRLKVAAIHSPHKSLGATLQFIGRFARTGSKGIGSAKFIAVPSEITLEAHRLYDAGAVWQQIVPAMIDERIEHEVRLRRAFRTFEMLDSADMEAEDLSLYSLLPFKHAKVFSATGGVDIDKTPEVTPSMEIVHSQYSEALCALVFVTKTSSRPKWSRTNALEQIEYDLFVVHYCKDAELLFICASLNSDAFYDKLAHQFCADMLRPLPISRLNKVLVGLQDAEFFNIGMRNRVHNSPSESYRMISGRAADKSIRRSDGRLFHQGHSFGRAWSDSTQITIGLSGSSKVWSNSSSRIPDLIDWLDNLAAKMACEAQAGPIPGWGLLPSEEETEEIPERVIAAEWDHQAFWDDLSVAYLDDSGQPVQCNLLDLELEVDQEDSSRDVVHLAITGPGLRWSVDFSLSRTGCFTSPSPERVVVQCGGKETTLLEYMNGSPPTLFCADFSSLRGHRLLTFQKDDLAPFGREEAVICRDWEGDAVDITSECTSAADKKSVHDCIRDRLLASDYDLVYYDHGSGEVADFVAVRVDPLRTSFEFYHCKGSIAAAPGCRVDDLYDLCGQAAKCVSWLQNDRFLLKRLTDRAVRCPERWVRGDRDAAQRIIDGLNRRSSHYRLVAVQPGISKGQLTEQASHILASASDYLIAGGGGEFVLLASI